MRYVRQWLASPTDESCPLGGKASYSSALKLPSLNSNSSSSVEAIDTVELSHFRTYHTPLKTQEDFIEALAAAQRISKDLGKRIGAEVFPYSLPYVFFQSCASPSFFLHLLSTS
jgi:Niemann-Pick C1 protein